MERRKLRSLGFQPLGRTAFDFHHHLGQRLVLAEVQQRMGVVGNRVDRQGGRIQVAQDAR
jgi:hypothetical protein